MPSDLVVNVRQISSYPIVAPAPPDALLLVQNGGLGSPYATVSASALVATALASGTLPLGVGISPPANAAGGQTFSEDVVFQAGGAVLNNFYFDAQGVQRYLSSGPASAFEWDPSLGFAMTLAPAGSAGQPVPGLTTMLSLSLAGNLTLPFGTLTVARDPSGDGDVTTLAWVGRNTVASFNGRIGAVTLWAQDIYTALCLDSAIATQNWVSQSIDAALSNFISTYPLVTCWNGRTGNVYLTLSDITTVFFQPGQQPIAPTPPITSNDNSIATTAWVTEYLANEFTGGGSTLATQAWVLANTVNSFNNRQGPVTLTLADVTNVGGAPINSPNFSGFPTAPTVPVGNVGGSIATTAYVWSVIQEVSTGVTTWNGRAGNVTLTAADIAGAGGLSNPSPNMTGNPTAPTQPPGTTLPLVATCAFVMTAVGNAVTSFNSRTGAVALLLSDVTGVGGAPLASPTFTGVPAAPTANAGTNTTQIATTAFVTAAIATAGGVASFNGRTGQVELEANDLSAVGALFNPSPQLTGTPIAPTATPGTNTNQIATTAFVITTIGSNAVASFNGRTGIVTLSTADITGAGGAPIANPTFTGTPAAPTAAPGTNNTTIATTAFVNAAIAADTTGVTSFNTRVGAVTLTTTDITGAGGAPAASPTFTGIPLAPTAIPGTANTQIATTAFVAAAVSAQGVTSFNGRGGAVTLIANDISAAGGALLASPIFTGVPAGPTAAPGTSTTQLATTAFVSTGYLPLTGGNLTGSLGVNYPPPANMIAGAIIANAAFIGNYGLNTYLNTAGSAWVNMNTNVPMTLNSNATGVNFNVAAAGTAGSASGTFTTPLTLLPNGTVYAAQNTSAFLGIGPSPANFNLTDTGAFRLLSFAGTGISLQYRYSDGVVIMQQTSGNTQFLPSGVITNSNTVQAPRMMSTSSTNFGFYSTASLNIFAFSANSYFQWNNQSADFGYQGPNALMTIQRVSDSAFIIPNQGYKPGGGVWADSSDQRIKTISGAYTKSLAAIAQLAPQIFTYLGNDTDAAPVAGDTVPYKASGHRTVATAGTQFIGLIADAVMQVFPECVTLRSGFIDGAAVDDLKMLDTTPLLYAIINALIEISTRLTALDGKQPA